MRKLSVFYEHILQACEQSGKTIPEVLAFCREQGISAVEMNYSLFASEREVIAPMLSDAGLVIKNEDKTVILTDKGRLTSDRLRKTAEETVKKLEKHFGLGENDAEECALIILSCSEDI